MKCKIDGCDRDCMYQVQQVCQKHYFRFMRNGCYESKQEIRLKNTGFKRKYRMQNPAGYQKLYIPEHPLSNQPSGYVYEHRYVVYAKYGDKLPNCEICNTSINWTDCHIDHIDKDVTNNIVQNLRPLCRGCNTGRTIKNGFSIEINGVTKTLMEWSRDSNCTVSHNTIKHRLLNGYSNYDAVFAKSITHPNAKTKKRFTKLQLFENNYK
jgi:5-methylcytosine-specific restriction endonuclease McrA